MPVGGTTETVTVLFTDLVASTELMARVGERAFDNIRSAHFDLLRQVLRGHEGDEVKTLGDGMMAVFASVSDAVSCAVAMQQEVDRHGRLEGQPLGLRVGLAVGDATSEDGDWFGAPVVTASRLCGACAEGQILATDLVRLIAQARCEASFRAVAALTLKGLPSETDACEVVWEPLPLHLPLPLPASLAGREVIPFVGRGTTLASLRRLWEQAKSGARRLVLVAGEPGIGKTRLTAELARSAHAEGATVLIGRCEEGLGVPYQPFVEALAHFVAHASASELRRSCGPFAGELTRLVPELSDRLPAERNPPLSDPDTARYRLFNAVVGWLTAASSEQPTLLVLDDLQFAAKPTLLLLQHLLVPDDRQRLLIVGTYRDTELEGGHPLAGVVAELRRRPDVERVALPGLDEDEVVDFVQAVLGGELEDHGRGLTAAMHRDTDGNPFFLGEVVRHLVETGVIDQGPSRRWSPADVGNVEIPERVRDVVQKRLVMLSENARQALTYAAVIGSEFEVAVLSTVTGTDEERLLQVLEEVIAAGLLREVAGLPFRCGFSHALVRSGIYDQLTAARRAHLHRRVGEAIEAVHRLELDDHLPALAHHFSRASAGGDSEKAVTYSRRAGEAALAQLAFDEAVAHFRQGLELLPADPSDGREQRCDLMIALGRAEALAGDPGHRQTLLDAAALAKALGDADRLSEAALANSRAVYSKAGEVDEDRVTVLEAALEALGPEDSARKACVLSNLAGELVFCGEWERRVRLADESLAMARRIDDEPTLAHVLAHRFDTIWHASTLQERLAISAELADLAARLDDPYHGVFGGLIGTQAAYEAGDLVLARHHLSLATGLVEELRRPLLRWFVAIPTVTMAMIEGRLEDAERLATEALELGGATGQPDAFIAYVAQLLPIRFLQGRLAELEQVVGAAASFSPGLPALMAAVAFVYSELDRLDEARSIFEEIASDDFAGVPHDLAWIAALGMSADACATLEDPARARVLYRLLGPYGDQFICSGGGWLGSVARQLGRLAALLGYWPEADEHFAAAAAAHEQLGARPWVARTQLDWARALRFRDHPGDAGRARAMLGDAVEVAAALGLAGIEQDGLALLERAGREQPAAGVSEPASGDS